MQELKESTVSLLQPLGSNDRFVLVTPPLFASEDSAVDCADDLVVGSVAGLQISKSNVYRYIINFFCRISNSLVSLTFVKGFQNLSIWQVTLFFSYPLQEMTSHTLVALLPQLRPKR